MNRLLEKYFAAVKNFIPQRSKASSVGMDIGNDSVKLIELIRSADSYQLVHWGIEPIEGNSAAAAVKKILEKFEIQTKSPATAVFGKGTLIRYIDLPRMSLEELKKSFAFESDKHLPFPQNQIFTDCFILDPHGKDKTMSVLVAASKKEIVNERIQLLSQLGLRPNTISINAIAIANVFHTLGLNGEDASLASASPEAKSSAAAVLDMGENVSNLMVLKGHLPCFNRDIFIGGQELDKRIANVLGVNVADAKKIKLDPKDKQETVLGACESILSGLISEIRLSFDYFITEKNSPIAKLYLAGGNANVNGIVNLFAKSLDLPVELWNPILSLKVSPGLSMEELNKNASRLGVALGLALYSE